jgi:hypothetical protein
MPYILPANVQPETLLCLKVFIPNDQLYLEAFSGAFNDFGRWTQWEKDGTNRASLAATTWKDAIDFTFLNGWLDCGENMDCCTEVLDRLTQIELSLQGLNNMNVNISNCGCGCGCSGGIPQENIPAPTGDFPLPPFPNSTPSPDPIDGWKCDVANQIWADWYALFTNFQASVIAGDATLAALIAIAGALAVLTGGLTVLLTILAGLAGGAAITVMGWVRDWLEAHQQGLICAITSGSTPADSYNNVVSYIAANANEPLGTTAGLFIKNQLTAVASDTDWNIVFSPDSVTIHPSLVGSSCEGCVGVFSIDDDWILVPVIAGTPSLAGGATVTRIVDNLWQLSGDNFAAACIEPDLTPFGYNWDLLDSDARGGYQVVVEFGALTSNFFNELCSMHGEEDPMTPGLVYRGGKTALASWVALGDSDMGWLGDGADHTDFRIQNRTGNTGTFTVRLWCVVNKAYTL